jgi:DNA-binding CsgD family transcriptional regulator
MLSQLVDDFRSRIKSTHRQPRFATLTPREKEILKFLAEGQSVKEIAQHLNLSVKTVEAHKFNLMRKLDIHNKAQLVQYAIQKKIIKIPVGAREHGVRGPFSSASLSRQDPPRARSFRQNNGGLLPQTKRFRRSFWAE